MSRISFDQVITSSRQDLSEKEIVDSSDIILSKLTDIGNFFYENISIDKIDLNELNNYSLNDSNEAIAKLGEDIKINGLNHNIVLMDTENGRYKLLSGERRFKAYKYLKNKYKEEKFNSIYSKVVRNLDEAHQMLILDGANLQTREGLSNEKLFRKMLTRFVENLKNVTGMTDNDAVNYTKEFVSASAQFVDRTLAVERNLNSDIKALLDKGDIPKHDAEIYMNMPEEVQNAVANAFNSMSEKGAAAIKNANDELLSASQKITQLSTELEKRKKGLIDVDSKIEKVQSALLEYQNSFETTDWNKDTERKEKELRIELEDLLEERKLVSDVIKKANLAISETKTKISDAGNSSRAGEVAQKANATVKKLEAAVKSVKSNNTLGLYRNMSNTGKLTMIDRIKDARDELNEAIARLEKENN